MSSIDAQLPSSKAAVVELRCTDDLAESFEGLTVGSSQQSTAGLKSTKAVGIVEPRTKCGVTAAASFIHSTEITRSQDELLARARFAEEKIPTLYDAGDEVEDEDVALCLEGIWEDLSSEERAKYFRKDQPISPVAACLARSPFPTQSAPSSSTAQVGQAELPTPFSFGQAPRVSLLPPTAPFSSSAAAPVQNTKGASIAAAGASSTPAAPFSTPVAFGTTPLFSFPAGSVPPASNPFSTSLPAFSFGASPTTSTITTTPSTFEASSTTSWFKPPTSSPPFSFGAAAATSATASSSAVTFGASPTNPFSFTSSTPPPFPDACSPMNQVKPGLTFQFGSPTSTQSADAPVFSATPVTPPSFVFGSSLPPNDSTTLSTNNNSSSGNNNNGNSVSNPLKWRTLATKPARNSNASSSNNNDADIANTIPAPTPFILPATTSPIADATASDTASDADYSKLKPAFHTTKRTKPVGEKTSALAGSTLFTSSDAPDLVASPSFQAFSAAAAGFPAEPKSGVKIKKTPMECFNDEKRAEVQAKYPDQTKKFISGQLAVMWSHLPSAQKQKYKKMATADSSGAGAAQPTESSNAFHQPVKCPDIRPIIPKQPGDTEMAPFAAADSQDMMF